MRAAAGVVSVALVLAAACLRGALLQSAGAAGQRRPFFERLRRLEAQFRQFQAVTLTHFQETGENYNLSLNLNTKVDQLLQKQERLQLVANGSRASTQEELHRLQTWVKKLERKGEKQALRIRALEEAWEEQKQQEQQESRLSNLTQELESHREDFRDVAIRQQSLQKTLQSLQDLLHRQGSKLGSIKRKLKSLKQKEALPSPWTAAHPFGSEEASQAAGGQSPTLKKLRAKHHQLGGRLEAPAERGPLLGQVASHLQVDPGPASSPQTPTEEPPGPAKVPVGEKPPGGTRKPGTRCNVGAMLVFPNASTQNFAAFQPSLQTSLLELSLCSWVRTSARYLGTILSYATEENDNKLVLHGRDAAPRNAIHFVIGDPTFRELPVGAVLDGRWHHACVIWSSLQGRYWFYLDRRLASLGTNFRKGYEIPPHGSLLLGQDQDVLGGGFESSESFVGLLAGFAMWDRALLPGEVSSIALGEGLPCGTVLTLANVSMLSGSVRKVDCTCLEHCL
ncbi:PREDICTED: pentraxin-4 [Thamnophis sirtalis]|uniref:Pentraxin-4 n=1 Tax=Thamnophis sirtalis TaxID=35019 RepID=A0A6I9YLN0_9SAUR|nr:PREDICTED: pentraxin-4 [Thamnophis sirtalis]